MHVRPQRRDRNATRPTSSWSSCGAINSAALLLRSANDRHPRGLGNGSDVVGRHYMGHINSVLMAISKCPNPTVFQKTLGVNDFYFGVEGLRVPDGAHLVRRQARRRGAVSGRAADRAGIHARPDGEALARLLADVRRSADPDNRVTLDRDGNIVLRYTPNNEEGHKRLIEKLEHADAAADRAAVSTVTAATRGCSRATCSSASAFRSRASRIRTARSASAAIRRPRRSIRLCKAHDVDNLYVVDGSFFPSSGAVNPALTIMANALRVGDHLLGKDGTDVRTSRHRCRRLRLSLPGVLPSCRGARARRSLQRLVAVGRGASA